MVEGPDVRGRAEGQGREDGGVHGQVGVYDMPNPYRYDILQNSLIDTPLARREEEFQQRMEKTEKQVRERLEKYLEEKETYLNDKEATIESDLKESYERIEKDLKRRYAEIHLAQTEADKKHIR